MVKLFKLSYLQNCLPLLFFMMLCGCIALYFGLDLGWDLANYHYYNPYAFLQDRIGKDYWPSSLQHVYFSPIADLFTFFLITYFKPTVTVFISGAVQGINFFIAYLIALRLINDGKYKIPIALLLSLLGLYGPIVLTEIGSFKNDNMASIFVLLFIYLQIKFFQTNDKLEQRQLYSYILSGFLLGIGITLKLTASLFVIGSVFGLLFLSLKNTLRFKLITLLILSVLVSYLLTNGYWMWEMWKHFNNPFYPFLENIFHHDHSGVSQKVVYGKCFQEGYLKNIFFPYYVAWFGTCDGFFHDLRYSIIYSLLILLLISPSKKETIEKKWLILFFIFTFISSQILFSALRYIVTLEIIAPIIIYLLVMRLSSDKITQIVVLIFLFYMMIMFMIPIKTIRAPWYEKDYFDVKLPSFINPVPKATLLIAFPAYVLTREPRPQSYLIPFFKKEWQFIGIPFLEEKALITTTLENKIKNLKSHSTPVFLLTTDKNMPNFIKVVQPFGLDKKNCGNVVSKRQKISNQQVLICQVI